MDINHLGHFHKIKPTNSRIVQEPVSICKAEDPIKGMRTGLYSSSNITFIIVVLRVHAWQVSDVKKMLLNFLSVCACWILSFWTLGNLIRNTYTIYFIILLIKTDTDSTTHYDIVPISGFIVNEICHTSFSNWQDSIKYIPSRSLRFLSVYIFCLTGLNTNCICLLQEL